MTDNFDGFDISDYGVPKTDGESWAEAADRLRNELFKTPVDSLSVSTDRFVRSDMERTERAITGAIRAGFDGVDINRPPLDEQLDPGNFTAPTIRDIEPWNYPAPDGANGFRTERYTWDWFSDEELAELLQADSPLDALEGAHE